MTPEVLIVIALYFLPAIVAAARHHPNQNAIFILNLLLGWTILGWIGALVWSSTFVAPHNRVRPHWMNLPSVPKASGRAFFVGVTFWVVFLFIVGIGIIIK